MAKPKLKPASAYNWKTVFSLEVALRLAWIRYNLGWSQERMAKYLGCSQNTVKNFETGRVPNVFVLKTLAKLIHGTIEWIATGEGENPLQRYSEAKRPPFRQTPWRSKVKRWRR